MLKDSRTAEPLVRWRRARREAVNLNVVVGALAMGAVATGALAIGVLAIGRLTINKARLREVEIDTLVVRRLKVLEPEKT